MEEAERMSAAGDGAGAEREHTTSSPVTPTSTTKKESANNARKELVAEKEASAEQVADAKERTTPRRGLMKAQEAERGSARAAKHWERAQRRRAGREEQPSQHCPRCIAVQDVRQAPSARAVGPEEEANDNDMGPGVTAEQKFDMPEPSDQFVEALKWSVQAHTAVREVKKRQDTLVDKLANLAMSDARRLELQAAGNVAGENDTRRGVAQQMLAAAAGLKVISADEWRDDEDTPVKASRARRPNQKKVRKGRTKALRQWERQAVPDFCPEGTFKAMGAMQRHRVKNARRLSEEDVEAETLVLPHATDSLKKIARQKMTRRCYEYHSGSINEPPCVKALDGFTQPVRVAKLRAARAEMMDLLPTATMEIKGERKPAKIDTGAQYSAAGESWAPYGIKLDAPPPVDFMEGFGGAAVKTERKSKAGWVAGILGSQAEPLSNKKDLALGDMGDEDKELMLNLLRRYPALLEPQKGRPPTTTLDIEHEIHTDNEALIKVRARRHAQLEHEVIDKALGEILDGGVVEEGHGAWGFPVVLVKKKDGSARWFCIDYRMLNAITKKDSNRCPG
ncbi:unnamed protein product [Phytophthora fragariaefolia]|uniref:Unnamed protein product n=1 Tax=Phytophthora fragariaefolia TaxID=1490495 RepID=A0A9W7D573_9STRA|nr:unnamed protein product [Phytophthora fragariaefolia]